MKISGVNHFVGEEGTISNEAVDALASRGIRELSDSKLIFTRDLRHRIRSLYGYPTELIAQFAMHVKCPHLVIKATRHGPWPMDDIDVIRKVYEEHNSANFNVEIVEGNHAVHLTNPEDVWLAIQRFLLKYNNKL